MATEKVGVYRKYYGLVPTDESGTPLPKMCGRAYDRSAGRCGGSDRMGRSSVRTSRVESWQNYSRITPLVIN